MKVWTTFYRRMVVIARPLDEPLPEWEPLVSVDIRLLTENDVSAYLACRPDHDADLVKDRLARHHRCFAAWHDDRIINVAWLATGRVAITYLRMDINLAQDEALLYNSFTAVSFRRRGLVRARDAFVLKHFYREGFRRVLAFIAVENKAGWKSMQAGGYRPIGMFHCLRFGPWQRVWLRADPNAELPRSTRTPASNDELR
jgi:hypothetical protein